MKSPPEVPIPPKHFKDFWILDPFCCTGVVLQEALLMGYNVYGSDLEPRMVDYTSTNISWLRDQHHELPGELKLDTGDATQHQWEAPVSTIATETYLGRPFSTLPDTETLKQVISDVNTIHKKFLQNLARQTTPGFRFCLAVPAWKTNSGFQHLPTLDKLNELGYNRVSFKHVSNLQLIYHRPEQVVARELVVLIRK